MLENYIPLLYSKQGLPYKNLFLKGWKNPALSCKNGDHQKTFFKVFADRRFHSLNSLFHNLTNFKPNNLILKT